MQVLSQKVNKIPITCIDLSYIVTKNHCINEESITTVKYDIFSTHTTFNDYNTL